MIHSCADPATSSARGQLLVLGHDLNGNGVGNALLFYLPIYYFAAMYGFRIVIDDDTSIGTFCHALKCRYPMLSTVQQSMANKASMFLRREDYLGLKNFSSSIVYKTAFGSWGFDGYRDLSMTLDLKCAVSLSGCQDEQLFKNFSLQSCFQHHAMQRLIEGGPFESDIISRVSKRLIGSTENHTLALLSLPHSLAPRFHVGIHVRAQFRSFEIQQVPSFAEVSTFLSSTRYGKIYRVLRDFVSRHITGGNNQDSIHLNDSVQSPRDSQISSDDYQYPKKILVYLSTDDERVKAHIINQLTTEDPTLAKSIRAIALRPAGVKHRSGVIVTILTPSPISLQFTPKHTHIHTPSYPLSHLFTYMQMWYNCSVGMHRSARTELFLPDSALDMAFDWYGLLPSSYYLLSTVLPSPHTYMIAILIYITPYLYIHPYLFHYSLCQVFTLAVQQHFGVAKQHGSSKYLFLHRIYFIEEACVAYR